MLTETHYPYAKTVQESKWQSKKLWEADIEIKKENILNSESSGTKVDGLLKICLVSHFGREDEEKPFLADLRSGHIPTGKQLLG